jgi:hypothetical protein
VAEIGDQATVEQSPSQEGRLMTMVLAPSRRQRRPEESNSDTPTPDPADDNAPAPEAAAEE